mgnify:CR=1 FL=1
MTTYSYIKDPQAIYDASFALVREQAKLDIFLDDDAEIAIRIIHACGMIDVAEKLIIDINAVSAGIAALRAGADIFCDCEMVASGITRRFLPADNSVLVTLNDPQTPARALADKTTRSAAAVDLWDERLNGGIVVIGNAPTALFRLLERIRDESVKPALILGFPVGFIGAAESKAALASLVALSDDSHVTGNHAKPSPLKMPAFITLHGTQGGSAIAAAALNALAMIARRP